MQVEVHEPRQHVHPLRVDLAVRLLRPALGAHHPRDRLRVHDRGDPVALDDDVDRPTGRRAGAVDQNGVSNDQPLVRPLPLGPRRRGRRVDVGRLCDCGERGGDRDQQTQRETAHRTTLEAGGRAPRVPRRGVYTLHVCRRIARRQ